MANKEKTDEKKAVEETEEKKAAEETQNAEQTKTKKSLHSDADYWIFDEQPRFVGKYKNAKRAVVFDEETGKDIEKCIGHVMEEAESGEDFLITNSYAIEKTFEEYYDEITADGVYVEIIFKGKGKNAKGRSFNKYDINLV